MSSSIFFLELLNSAKLRGTSLIRLGDFRDEKNLKKVFGKVDQKVPTLNPFETFLTPVNSHQMLFD
jgi:hypothetical protein